MNDKETLIPLIQKLVATVFTEQARICDRANIFPEKNFAAIKKHNLLALLVPKQYGGFGLSFTEYQKCLIEIAKGCPATASAFNMHNIIVGSLTGLNLAGLSERDQKRIIPYLEQIYALILDEKTVFAAATTEPGIGARFSKVQTSFTRNQKGYVLNGTKSFVTMAHYADYYLVLANKKEKVGTEDTSHLTYFLVPRKTPGISVNSTWDTMGMRATGSHEVNFSNVQLLASDVFMGREGFALNKVMKEPHWVTGGYLGVYLGIMEAAYQFTCEFIKQKSNYQTKNGLAFQPLIQARVGEMSKMLHLSRLALFEASRLVDHAPGNEETNHAIYAAKYIIGEYAHQFTGLAIKTCGGSSIHKMYDLERYHRDSACGALMPAVSDMCQLYLGKYSLDIIEKNIW